MPWDLLIAQCAHICDYGGVIAPEQGVLLYDAAGNAKPACPISDAMLDLVCPSSNTAAPVSSSNPRHCPSGIDCVYQDWSSTSWGVCDRSCSNVAITGGAGVRSRHRTILSHGLAITPCEYDLTLDVRPCNAESSYSSAPQFTCVAAPEILPGSLPGEGTTGLLRIGPESPAWPPAAGTASGVAAATAVCDATPDCAAFEMDAATGSLRALYTRPLDFLIENGYCAGHATAVVMDAPCGRNAACEYSSWELVQACPACAAAGTTPHGWEARDITRGALTGTCPGPLLRESSCAAAGIVVPPCASLPTACQYGEWPSTQAATGVACDSLPAPRIFPDAWDVNTGRAWGTLPGWNGSYGSLFHITATRAASIAAALPATADLQQVLATLLNSQALTGVTGLPVAADLPNNAAAAPWAFAWAADASGWDVLSFADSLTDPRCAWTDAEGFTSLAARCAAAACDRANAPGAGTYNCRVRDPLWQTCECASLCDAEHPETCAWSQCHGKCGTGKQYVFRDIVAGPANGGEPCSMGQQVLERDCSTGHPCTASQDCPYGVNGKICSGHGTCVTATDGNEVCQCDAPWSGAYCDVICPLSQLTGTACGLLEDAAILAALNAHVGTALSSSAIRVNGWRAAGTPNACEADGTCVCGLLNAEARAAYAGEACGMLCPAGTRGLDCTVPFAWPAAWDHRVADLVAGTPESHWTLDIMAAVDAVTDARAYNAGVRLWAAPYSVRGWRFAATRIGPAYALWETQTLSGPHDSFVLNAAEFSEGTGGGQPFVLGNIVPQIRLRAADFTWLPAASVKLVSGGAGEAYMDIMAATSAPVTYSEPGSTLTWARVGFVLLHVATTAAASPLTGVGLDVGDLQLLTVMWTSAPLYGGDRRVWVLTPDDTVIMFGGGTAPPSTVVASVLDGVAAASRVPANNTNAASASCVFLGLDSRRVFPAPGNAHGEAHACTTPAAPLDDLVPCVAGIASLQHEA